MKVSLTTAIALVLSLFCVLPDTTQAFRGMMPPTLSQPRLVRANKPTNTRLCAKKGADVETVRKNAIIASIAEKLDMTKSEADEALAAVLESITENVVAGKKVNLAGFGTFQLRLRAARKGRNPQTGEEIQIKASKSPGFTAAKAFKEAANE